eukprot:gene30882-37319_t
MSRNHSRTRRASSPCASLWRIAWKTLSQREVRALGRQLRKREEIVQRTGAPVTARPHTRIHASATLVASTRSWQDESGSWRGTSKQPPSACLFRTIAPVILHSTFSVKRLTYGDEGLKGDEYARRQHYAETVLKSYWLQLSSTGSAGIQNEVDNRRENLEIFANLVAKGYQDVHISAAKAQELVFPDRSSDRITRYHLELKEDSPVKNEQDGESSLEAWVLPPSVLPEWPHISIYPKQDNILGQDVLFRRVDAASVGREAATMDVLIEEGKAALWIGLAGIGKSMASMTILIKCLERLQKSTEDARRLNEVWYRVESSVYKFTCDQNDGNKIVVKSIPESDWNELRGYAFKKKSILAYKRALIAEMAEKEVDPGENGFYTSSSEGAFETTFKTLRKDGNIFFLMDPPTPAEIRMIYATYRALDGGRIPKHIDSVAKVDALLADIGPVPRALFSSDDDSLSLYLAMRNTALAQPFTDLHKLSISNVGDHLKYFMAPFIRPGVSVPLIAKDYNVAAKEYLDTLSESERAEQLRSNIIFQFRALSERCKVLLASKVKTPLELEFLQNYGYPWELLESTVKYAGVLQTADGVGNFVAEQSQLPNWLWYSDPGPVALCRQDELADSALLQLVSRTKRCKRTIHFAETHLSLNVWEIEEGVLYESTKHNMGLVEWWIVLHDLKLIVGHQVTMSKMTDHAFSTSTVDNALKSLNMLKGPGQEYKMLIIGVNDCSLESPTGMVFAHKVPATSPLVKKTCANKEETEKEGQESEEEKNVKLGLKHWQKYVASKQPDTWENADRVETVMARVRVFGLPSFVLTQDRSPKLSK